MSTVGQLLQAQRIILDWNEKCGEPLEWEHMLDTFTGPYLLEQLPGPLNRPRPCGLIMLGISHKGHFHALTVPAGNFLFQALRDMDIEGVNFLVDARGKIYGADFRVWKPLNLTTLHPMAWPPLQTLLLDFLMARFGGLCASCLHAAQPLHNPC